MTRSRESTVVVTVAIRGRPRDQRDLAEEVTPLERPHFAALALHLRLPVDEDEELPAERSFADELSPGAEVDLIGELRDLREFLLRAAREQWDALDRLNLRVPRERHAASHQSVTRDDDQQSPTTDSACKEFALMMQLRGADGERFARGRTLPPCWETRLTTCCTARPELPRSRPRLRETPVHARESRLRETPVHAAAGRVQSFRP